MTLPPPQPAPSVSDHPAEHDPRSMILQACLALFAAGQVTELRILGLGDDGRKHNASGWFNDFDALAKTASNFDSRTHPEGIYVTLNPVHSACLARSNNGVKEYLKVTTSDKDILRRNWLPIDIDPARPAGVSSTEAELAQAREVARAVATWLEGELAFPPGIRACSGNGIHLLYRIDLPNDDEGKAIVTRCLAALSAKFSTDTVKVDQSNVNAARIFKLYGTTARKGDALPDRPHRRAYLFSVNGAYPTFDQIACVPGIALQSLSEQAGASPAAQPAAKVRRSASTGTTAITPTSTPTAFGDTLGQYAVDLDAFCAAHNIPITRIEQFDGTGLRYYLQACLFDSSHTGTSAILGRAREGAIFYKCQHDSCTGKEWRDVCQLFEGTPTAASSTTAAATRKAPAPKPIAKAKQSDSTELQSDDPWGLASAMLDEDYTDPDTSQIMLRRHRQTFYKYSTTKRKYCELTDDTVRVSVTRWLGDRVDKVTTRKVSDVINCFGAMVTVPADMDTPFMSQINPETHCSSGDPIRRNWLTLSNGILDIERVLAGDQWANCLLSHTPEWFTVTSLPFPFPITEEQGYCPNWLAFLDEVFQGDEERIAILQEAFGCCFLGRNLHEVFFVLHGTGRNGKSTVINVLKNLLGEENVSSLSMEQLAIDTFACQLQNKIANLCSDMNEMDRVQEGILKSVVSGDLISARRLYKEPIQFRPRCTLWFGTNSLPRFTDTSIGIWRRMKLIPFDFTVDEDKKDVNLLARLSEEMPGILMWALNGMVRLSERGRFTESGRCKKAVREYRLSCFPILMFLDECTYSVEGYSEVAGDLWIAYRKWCRSCGLSKTKPVHQFIKDVIGFLNKAISYTRVEGVAEAQMHLHGIKLKPEQEYLTLPVSYEGIE